MPQPDEDEEDDVAVLCSLAGEEEDAGSPLQDTPRRRLPLRDWRGEEVEVGDTGLPGVVTPAGELNWNME